MKSVAALTLGVASATLLVLLAHKPSRRRARKLARVLWDGDEAFAEQHARLLEVAATAAAWSPDTQLATLDAELAVLERATAAGERGLAARRAALQKRLGAAHGELWKAQDALDKMTADFAASGSATSLDAEDVIDLRTQRKGLVAEVAKALDAKDGLAARFKAMAAQAAGGGGAAAAAASSPAAPRGAIRTSGYRSGEQLRVASDASPASEMRGYKLNADGRKTSYFNHDLDDEAKALIGDIAPKKIEAEAASSAAPVDDDAKSRENGGASAWNSAGTWEERNVGEWGRARLADLLRSATAVDDDESRSSSSSSSSSISGSSGGAVYAAVVKRVHAMTGDCAVTSARGKVKHLFDLSFTVDWALEEQRSGGGAVVVCTGRLTYLDVTPAELGPPASAGQQQQPCGCDLEPCLEVDGPAAGQPPQLKEAVDRLVRPCGFGLQAAVAKQVQAFAAEFNAL